MVKVAEEWLNICGGCEVTILDIGEPLLDLLPSLQFVHIPVLMDHKYFGQTGEKSAVPAIGFGKNFGIQIHYRQGHKRHPCK